MQVLCVGPTGTGKTLTISDKLLKNLPLEYITHFLTFSARTSANQTQDLIDSKLDKRQNSCVSKGSTPVVDTHLSVYAFALWFHREHWKDTVQT